MLTNERFNVLLKDVKKELAKILQANGLKLEEIGPNYSGPKIELTSGQFMHLLEDTGDLPRDKFMDIGCALLNLEYENIYFTLMGGDTDNGYVYEMMINYSLDHD